VIFNLIAPSTTILSMASILSFVLCCIRTPRMFDTRNFVFLKLQNLALALHGFHGTMRLGDSRVQFLTLISVFLILLHPPNFESGTHDFARLYLHLS
jgi:hypothetical protein